MRKGNNKEGRLRKRSILLPESFIKEMAEIRERIGAQSDSEVIRRAFNLYKKLIAMDGEITVVGPDGERKVILPD